MLPVCQATSVTNWISSTFERFNAMFYRRSHEPDQLQLCERNGRGIRSHIASNGGATTPRGYVASIISHVARCGTVTARSCWQGHGNIESALILLHTFALVIFCCCLFAVLYCLLVLTVFVTMVHTIVFRTHMQITIVFHFETDDKIPQTFRLSLIKLYIYF